MRLNDRIEVANQLGECVLWDDASGAVWWTDIDGRAIHRLDWQTRVLRTYPTPHRLASFGFVDGSNNLVAAFESGFALFDPISGATSTLIRPEGLAAGQRMNDGRVDRQGRFWAGSMVEMRPGPAAARLYCIGAGRIETREQDITIANGLCWSPDGTICYFADSVQRIIWRYRFDAETGALFDRRVFACTQGRAVPDGAAIDAEGYMWSAQWGGGCVIRYAPNGNIDRVVEVPVSQPTCVAFGGPDLTLLFVTSAQSGLEGAETGAGDLFVYNAGVRGLKESRFQIGAWPETAAWEG